MVEPENCWWGYRRVKNKVNNFFLLFCIYNFHVIYNTTILYNNLKSY